MRFDVRLMTLVNYRSTQFSSVQFEMLPMRSDARLETLFNYRKT